MTGLVFEIHKRKVLDGNKSSDYYHYHFHVDVCEACCETKIEYYRLGNVL